MNPDWRKAGKPPLLISGLTERERVLMDAQAKQRVLDGLFGAFNRHDAEGVLSFMTSDCVFDAAAGQEAHGARHVGREAVGRAFAQVWATYPDAHWELKGHLVGPERALSEWTLSGTRPDGMRLEADGCDVFTFAGDKIRTKSAYRKERPLSR